MAVTYAHLQSVGPVTTNPAAFTVTPAAGSYVIIVFTSNDATVPTIVDSASGEWSKIHTSSYYLPYLHLYIRKTISDGSSITITVTSSSSVKTILAGAVSGSDGSYSKINSAGYSGGVVTVTSEKTKTSNDLFVNFAGASTGSYVNVNFNTIAGWTAYKIGTGPTQHLCSIIEVRSATAAGQQQVNIGPTLSFGSGSTNNVIMVFYESYTGWGRPQ